ncbi:hypothetical protein LXL04_025802 [Taraxacum kok-saghyz]
METPSLRVRLEFGDRSILSKRQRSDGMNKSWLLLKLQQHRTISDVCTHLLHIYKLHHSCPNGILLSMDGFVLPPFESTEILKDKELISVKKKGETTSDADNLLDDVEVDDMEPGDNGLLLLANDKRTEEPQNESEEVDEEHSHEEPVCKKRKAPIKLQNSKSKRQCLDNNIGNEAETQELDNVKKVDQVNQDSAPGVKKMASRSARRKKAKRQWMQELAKIGKKKPQQYSKPEVTKPENRDANGGPKGLLHWKQASSQKPVHKNRLQQSRNQNGDVDFGVVTKPGHIRFQNYDEDEGEKQTAVSNETFRRNSSNGKKKGQRWGGSTGKFANYQRNESKRIDKKSLKIPITDMQVPVIDPNDFNKLPPCCEPKEGDVIAYRLLELSSSWIPEFSSFRVGRISYYDARDIVLIPVPEYPFETDKTDDNRPNDSLYGEDGSLEINYSALLDVCYVKQYDPEAVIEQPSATNVSKDSNTGDGEANPWDHLSKGTVTSLSLPDVNHPSMVGGTSDASNQDKGKGIMGNCNPNDPWSSGWSKKIIGLESSENDCGEGSSWGRPWSSFAVPSRGTSVNMQNNWGSMGRGSSRGNGRQWTPRGRGRGRGRGQQFFFFLLFYGLGC